MDDAKSHPLSRAWEWWHSDSGRRIFVASVWAALAGCAFGYAILYARNWPVNDEWAFVGDFLGGEKPRLEWIFERHAEHRYPVARAILVLIDETCGHDYRIATLLNAAVMSLASGFLILAARRMRGTTEYTDCLFPAVLLHRGHCENLLMGYQIAFTLSVCFATLYLWGLAASRPRLWPAAFAVLGLAGGGGPGLLFAIPLGFALLAIALTRRAGYGPCLFAALAIVASSFQMVDALRRPSAPRNGVADTATVFLQVADGAFGRGFGDEYAAAGWIAIGGAVIAGFALTLSARSAPEASRSLALLAVLAGSFGFQFAVGLIRPDGHAYRGSAFSQFAVVVPWLWATRFPRRRRWHTVVGAILVAVVATQTVRLNWGIGIIYGDRYCDAYEAAADDARRGIPIAALAERNHYYFQIGEGNARAWDTLRERGMGPAVGSRREPLLAVAEPGVFRMSEGGKVWGVGPVKIRGARAVRVRGSRPAFAEWTSVRFTWVEIDAEGIRTARAETRSVWRIPGPWSALLWIEGDAGDIAFECDGIDRPESVEWLR